MTKHATSNKMRPFKKSSPIDLTTWTLFGSNIDKLEREICRAVTDTLREVFKEQPPELYFRSSHAGDPATICVDLPLGRDSYVYCGYACSLEGAVNDFLEVALEEQEQEERDHGVKIAARLRELADRLDAACKK